MALQSKISRQQVNPLPQEEGGVAFSYFSFCHSNDYDPEILETQSGFGQVLYVKSRLFIQILCKSAIAFEKSILIEFSN